MLYKKALLLLCLFFMAATAAAGSEVNIVAQVDEVVCKKVATETCETHKKDAEKKCTVWHRNKAEDVGANQIVMTDSSYYESKRPMFDGRFKTIRNSSITADYYSCATNANAAKTDDEPETSGEAVESVNQSIEERLIRLKGLYDKSLITEEEYQAKREEILSEL